MGSSADSVISSIKAKRSSSRHSRSLKPSSSVVSKPQAAHANQRQIRKAKIIRNSHRFSSPSANIGSKVSSNDINVESRTLISGNGSSCPGLENGIRAIGRIKDRPPNSQDGSNFISNTIFSYPSNWGIIMA